MFYLKRHLNRGALLATSLILADAKAALFSLDKTLSLLRLASSTLLITYLLIYLSYPEDRAVGLVYLNNHLVSSLVHIVFDHLYLEIVR